MISCIILAAGFSSRFGSPKALAKLNGINVIESLQKTLLETSVKEIIVVLGAHSDQIKSSLLNHKKVRFVYNKDYNFGQTSSFKVGLKNISSGLAGIMLLPVDYPFVGQATIEDLVGSFLENKPTILIPTFNNKKGHPPIFHAKLKEEFLLLDDSVGINTINHLHKDETMLFPTNDQGIIATFNTLEEFEKLKKSI